MMLAILYKGGRLKIFKNIYALNIDGGSLVYTASMDGKYCYTDPLAEVLKVSVNGIIYYDDGKVKL